MFFKGDQAKQVEMVPGVRRRTLGHGNEMLLAEFTLRAGSEVPTHRHPNSQVGYVVSGSMEMTVADETSTLKSGDSYYIPADVPHKAVTREDSLVVDTFYPPRQDYLEG